MLIANGTNGAQKPLELLGVTILWDDPNNARQISGELNSHLKEIAANMPIDENTAWCLFDCAELLLTGLPYGGKQLVQVGGFPRKPKVKGVRMEYSDPNSSYPRRIIEVWRKTDDETDE